eukprot:gnl/Chilomastix_caulleri/3042.p1 GENE.gnl/Chilomastix_caulleri/3042~~gnl/Chilomastix_caulleri/3042.p1  ORF type:complete len:58 (+),score=5.25 gnl/Chilomastix_caulleri/3042:150-323(+)
MKVFGDGKFYTTSREMKNLNKYFGYRSYQSIVRVYRDVFLVYNNNIKHWCLIRIIAP